MDGILVDSANFLIANPIVGNPGENNDFVIGDQWAQQGIEEFDGAIDEVRVWNFAMDPSEVMCNQTSDLDIYNTLPPSGLVAYYDFEDLSGPGPLANRITFSDFLVMDNGPGTDNYESSLNVQGVWGIVPTTEIFDETTFDALTNGQYQIESYDAITSISEISGFSLSGDRVDPPATPADGVACVEDGMQAVLWTERLTITFDAPTTAFATYLYDLGDFGGSGGVELRTNTGEIWTAAAPIVNCGQLFTGIVTGTPFTEITIEILPVTAGGNPDGVYIDKTFYGQQAYSPGVYALEQIPNEINWIVTDIANSEVCTTNLTVNVPVQCQASFTAGGSEEGATSRSKKADITETDFEISLAPNPSAGLVAIGLKGLNQDTDMMIMDLSGRLIHQERVMAKTIKVFVDVSERKYQNGVYVVAFRINEQVVTKKLVVLK